MNKDCTIDFSSGTCSDEKEPVPDEKNLKIRVLPYFMRVPSVFLPFTSCTCAPEHVPYSLHKNNGAASRQAAPSFFVRYSVFIFFLYSVIRSRTGRSVPRYLIFRIRVSTRLLLQDRIPA